MIASETTTMNNTETPTTQNAGMPRLAAESAASVHEWPLVNRYSHADGHFTARQPGLSLLRHWHWQAQASTQL
jgi:hypothetical protein